MDAWDAAEQQHDKQQNNVEGQKALDPALLQEASSNQGSDRRDGDVSASMPRRSISEACSAFPSLYTVSSIQTVASALERTAASAHRPIDCVHKLFDAIRDGRTSTDLPPLLTQVIHRKFKSAA